MLICKLPPGEVQFDFNPKNIQMARRTSSGQRPNASTAGAGTGSTGSILRGSAQSTIDIKEIVLQGADTKSRCDQLLDWMNPGGGLLSRLAGMALSAMSGGAINLA